MALVPYYRPRTEQPQDGARLQIAAAHVWATNDLGDGYIRDGAGNANGTFSSGLGIPGAYWRPGPDGWFVDIDSTGTGTFQSAHIPVGNSSGSGAPAGVNFTVLARVRFANFGQTQSIYTGGTGAFGLRVNTAGKMEFMKVATVLMGTSTKTLSTGVDYDLCVTYDGSLITFYVDGVAAGTVTNAQTFSHGQQYMLCGNPGFDEPFRGPGARFHRAIVINRTLSAPEVAALVGAGFWSSYEPQRLYISATASGGGASSGALAASESGADTAAASGAVLAAGALAAAETGADVAALAGAAAAGALAASESGSDTASIAGTSLNASSGTIAAAESGADTAAIAGAAAAAGAIAAVETGADTAALAGAAAVSASLAAIEAGADLAALSGLVAVAGILVAAESGADTASIVGAGAAVGATGALAAVESGTDAATVTGAALAAALIAAVESGADIASLAGQILVTGALAAAESGADVAAIAGGGPGATRTGTLAAVEQGADAAAVFAAAAVAGLLAAVESGADTASLVTSAPLFATPGYVASNASARSWQASTVTRKWQAKWSDR